jgi:hypothetical protein
MTRHPLSVIAVMAAIAALAQTRPAAAQEKVAPPDAIAIVAPPADAGGAPRADAAADASSSPAKDAAAPGPAPPSKGSSDGGCSVAGGVGAIPPSSPLIALALIAGIARVPRKRRR